MASTTAGSTVDSIGNSPASRSSSSRKGSSKSGRIKKTKTVIDGFVILALLVGAAAVLGFYPGARDWAVGSLSLGWIPATLWAAAVAATLRYNPRWTLTYWRRWTAAAVVAALAIGVLSAIVGSYGPFVDVNLGGEWGQWIGGTSYLLAGAKLAAILAVSLLVLWPKRVGVVYYRGLAKLAYLLQLAVMYLYQGTLIGSRYLGRSWRKLRYAAYHKRKMASMAAGAAAPGEAPVSVADNKQADVWGSVATVPEPIPGTPSKSPLPVARTSVGGWQLPPTSSLTPPDAHHAPEAALQQMARLVETTLGDHGVRVEVTGIKAGPRIVQFGLVPGWVTRRGGDESGLERSRVKVQSILTREKDMALALKTPYLRVEAPVPGEALVGLEVPNPSPSKVHLLEVMDSKPFSNVASKGGLPIAMGQDTAGGAVALDLAALPHILIAGATGAGKSVLINSIVASFLWTKTPDQLRIIMVDPKRVELTPFNGIPHLVAPVIVDADKVTGALGGLIREMMGRYKLMEESGVRNIDGYNQRSPDKMPYLVLIVDELADLMMVGGFEIEQQLVRLAQLGRATGIHLVLATQRPSVNVVTGLLKANIAARAAFAVASQVDSRVILDAVGAEKLMGKGDMLLLDKESPKARRVQGTLVYDEEIEQVVQFWVNQQGPPLPVINLDENNEEEEEGSNLDAHMMEEARELAARNPELSVSYLERRLKIGGRKANEIMEALEEEGFMVGV